MGAYQDVPVEPGDDVIISASLFTRAGDRIDGDAQAWINLEFYKADDQLITIQPLVVLNSSSPAETWIPATVGPYTAPAFTAYARMTCVWTWNGFASGSAYWDDCQLTVNGGLNELSNGDFETAGFGEQSPFGIDDWTGFNNQEQSSDAAEHGTKSVKLNTDTPYGYSGLYQNMAELGEGDHVYLHAWVWNPSADPLTSDSQAGLKLEFHPAGGTSVPPPEENLAFNETSDQDTWTYVDLETTVPPDVTIGRIACIYNGTPEYNRPRLFRRRLGRARQRTWRQPVAQP